MALACGNRIFLSEMMISTLVAPPRTLEEFRAFYELNNSDPDLRAALAAHPWIFTWDDHEVDNNYADLVSEEDAAEAAFTERRAAGYQAWYEFMPVRLDPPDGADTALAICSPPVLTSCVEE